MSHLAAQQSAMLQALNLYPSALNDQNAIFLIATKQNNTSARGLKAYQSNQQALALRSLQTAYPVVEQLIGADAFAMLASDLWRQAPPLRGDLAQWGADLAGLIQSIEALNAEPYLPDVAQIEWALHRLATAADASVDLSTLALLTTQAPDTVTLQLYPSATLLASDFPAASIVSAHLYAQPTFEVVGQKLRAQTPEVALLWRNGLRSMLTTCPAADALFIQNLLDGASLSAALDAAADFDFNHWLPQAAQNGLLLGARLLAAPNH